MAAFPEKLERIVKEYLKIEERKHHIEDKTAYVITNSKYYENTRHGLKHLINALALMLEEAEQASIEEQCNEAYYHLENVDVNGYEYLAGYFLSEVRDKLDRTNLYTDIGKAENLEQEALRHYDRGRNLRATKKIEAMDQFEKCIDICIEAKREIVPVKETEKRQIQIGLLALVVAVVSFGIAVIGFFAK
jgi:soluble cytochrome b562